MLPLENLSPEQENPFFSAGMHQEILNQLSKVSGLGVFARTTMQQYANADRSVVEIGRELGAAAVLEGSVRRAAGRVRISVQLIDPDSRAPLWSETYERELSPEAIFDIQADIAEQITSALEANLAASERSRIAAAPTHDMVAYDAYLRGRDHLWKHMVERRPVFVDSAVADLRVAVTADTSFAQAYGLLGAAYAFRFYRSGDTRWNDSARIAADRAVQLQPGVAESHLARGIRLTAADSLDAAEGAFRRFLERGPRHPFAILALAIINRPGTDADRVERLRWRLRMLRYDPHSAVLIQDLVGQLIDLGLYDAAEAWRRYGLEHNPENRALKLHRIAMLRARGRYREALEFLREVPGDQLATAGYLQLKLGYPEEAVALLEREQRKQEERLEASPTVSQGMSEQWRTILGYAHLRAGDEERGRSILRQTADSLRAQIARGSNGVDLARLAQVHHALGRMATARDDLRVAVMDLQVLRPLRSPIFDPARNDPWFRQFFEQVEATLEGERAEVRRMQLNLHPPG